MKTILRIAPFILVLALCLGMLSSCGGITVADVEKDPYGAITDAFEMYADDIDAKYGKVLDVFDSLENGVSTHELKLNVPDILDATLNVASDGNGLYNGKLNVGSEGINAELKVWADESNVALSLPALLGEGKYGVKYDTLWEDVKTAPILGTIGISYDDLEDMLESEAGLSVDDIKSTLDVKKLDEAYNKYIADSEGLIKGKTPVVAEETVGETDTITVEYTFTKDDAKKYLDLTMDMYKSIFGDILASLDVDLDELIPEMDASLDELKSDVKEKIYLIKKNGSILKNVVTVGESVITVNYSTDSTAPLNVTIDAKIIADGETVEFNVTCKEPEEAEAAGVYVDVSAKSEGEEITAGASFLVNTDNGEYEFEVIADGHTFAKINGTLTYNDQLFKVTVESITVDEETIEFALSYEVKAGVELDVEKVPEYKDVLDITQDDLIGIIENIAESPLGEIFMGATEDNAVDGYYDDTYVSDGE